MPNHVTIIRPLIEFILYLICSREHDLKNNLLLVFIYSKSILSHFKYLLGDGAVPLVFTAENSIKPEIEDNVVF